MIQEPLLAVLNYKCDGVGSARWIIYDASPEKYIAGVAQRVVDWLKMLVEHYAEDVNLSELDLLHENFGEGEHPEDGWSWGRRGTIGRANSIQFAARVGGRRAVLIMQD